MIAGGSGDVIVAKVAGRPVFGSCVAGQLERGTPTREQALRECVDFELLAQEAERHGFATNPDVVEATRTALVGRLCDRFEARYPDPASLHDEIKKEFDKTDPDSLTRPEFRLSWTAVFTPDGDGPDADRRAHELADKVDASLTTQAGLFHQQLEEASHAFPANGVKIAIQQVKPMTKDDPRFETAYREALFAIPEIGRVSPVFHTRYGYHIVLLQEIFPAKTLDFATSEPLIFAQLRRDKFQALVEEAIGELRSVPKVNYAGLEPPK
jgi:hypothetical protein